MHLSQLKYFVKVVECGSITKAAQELFISQPSLTKSIASLESEFNLQLLERNAKGVRVSTVGREFLTYAKDVLDSALALEQTFTNRESQEIQRLCVASQQFDFVYDTLEQIFRQNDMCNVCLDLIETNRGGVIERLENRDADVGLLVLTDMDSKEFKASLQDKALEYHTLDHSNAYVGMFPSSPFYDRKQITEAEASSQLHVALDMDRSMRRDIYLKAVNLNVDHSKLIFCNTIGACAHFMEHCGAMLYAPSWVWGMFHDPRLHLARVILGDGYSYTDVNQLVWIKRKKESLSIIEAQFLELLRKRFKG